MAMALPKLGEKKNLWDPNYGNAIAEIGRKKIFVLAIMAMALPKMGKKKKKGYEICERVKKKKKKLSCPQYFYNIFTINHTWLVIISSKKFVTN